MQAVIRTVQQAEAFFGPAYNRGQIDPNNFTGQVSSYWPDSGSQNERESLKMKHLLFCLTLRLSPVLPKKTGLCLYGRGFICLPLCITIVHT